MKLPSVVFTDIDGVWTDGGMYYDQTGNEWKKFNTRDGAGVLFLKKLNIPLVILTGENTAILGRRAEKLKIEFVFQGVKDKLAVAKQFCLDHQLDLSQAAHIGDDIIDLKLLEAVGFSACPADAPDYIQSKVDWVTKNKGGEGAFRDFVEKMVVDSGNEAIFFSIYS